MELGAFHGPTLNGLGQGWRGWDFHCQVALSTAPRKEAVVRWEAFSSPGQPGKGQGDIASGCASGGPGCTLGGISSQKGLTLEWTARGAGTGTVPDHVQEPSGRGT